MPADREEHLLDHDYDGIAEYDNPMPRWWVYVFWVTIAFAVAYWLNVGGMKGPGRSIEYEQDMAAYRAAHPAPAAAMSTDSLSQLAHTPAIVAEGKTVFAKNCAACHRADGGGLIGPNLTDDAWLHGGTLSEIWRTVNDGVLAKGMPAWGKMLSPAEVSAAVAYVSTLHGTNPPNPKPPQGVVAKP